jgi:hypothetical protein
MSTAGSASDEVSRARARMQAFGTLATSVGTSVLAVGGYQSYVKSSDPKLTLGLLGAVLALVFVNVGVMCSPWQHLRISELKDKDGKYLRWAAGAGLRDDFGKAQDAYLTVEGNLGELKDRDDVAGLEDWQKKLIVEGRPKLKLAEGELREIGELVRTQHRLRWAVITLLVITVAEVGLALSLFATLPKTSAGAATKTAGPVGVGCVHCSSAPSVSP